MHALGYLRRLDRARDEFVLPPIATVLTRHS